MSVTYDVIADGMLVLQSWSGKVAHDDLMVHENQHLIDPRIKPGASVLVDARAAHCGITEEEVRGIVGGLYAIYRQPLKIKKCALLVNDLTYPLARAYERSVDQYGVSVIAFTFLDGACAWLGLNTKMVASHLDRFKKAQSALPEGT